jgi:Alpha/beta hydrolase domain
MKRSFARAVGIAVFAATAAFGIRVLAYPEDQASQGVPARTTPRALTGKRIPCDEFLVQLRTVAGKASAREFKVGPTSCLMVESRLTIGERSFRRLDLGLDGTVDGFVSTNPQGDYRGYMTNAPDLVFPQTADAGPVVLAIAKYRKDHGAAMSVIYPADPSDWNGKMWVTVHGASGSTEIPWDGFDPSLSSYDEQMLARGYVLVKTRRTANADGFTRSPKQPPTGIATALETDKAFDYAGFNDTHRYIMDFTVVAENLIQKRLGQSPARTYFYGHSAGARIGRGLNYVAGLNKGPDGKPMFDGIFVDDSAAGTWLPLVMKNGRDVLFSTDAEKSEMVPQLEMVHQMYNRIWPTQKALGVTDSYLENKRTNARMMRDKGLTSKFRAYEVRSISHSAGGPHLDVSPLWGDIFDVLDAWVDRGVEPPPTRSDWAELGDVDRDEVIENPGISLPEVACPLGVYYPTTSTSGSILFAPFTGTGLEPLDLNKVFVDMNRNGVWDYRETPTTAWRRLGLLQLKEELTREKYVACVQAAAETLQKDGFITGQTVAGYVARAKAADLQPKDAPAVTSR